MCFYVIQKAKTVLIFVLTSFVIINSVILDKHKCTFDDRCRCKYEKDELYVADCSNLKLREIPRFPNNIRKMDLSRNLIGQIQKDIFSNNTRLITLDVSYNILYDLDELSFSGLDSLETLLIDNNKITSVDNDTLLSVRNLKTINFKKNAIKSLNLNFTSVVSLVTAKLDFTVNEKSSVKQFWGLENLRNLDLSGLSGNCKVKTLTPDTFELLPALESLNLSACFINYIYIGTFSMLSRLAFLDVSFNRCLKSTGIENITHDLPYTSIKILKINSVRNVFDLTLEVTNEHFEKLSVTNMTELYAEGNRIQLFEEGALTKLPSTLKHISLADNEFAYGKYFHDFSSLPIVSLNLSFLFSTHDPRINKESCDIDNDIRTRHSAPLSIPKQTDNDTYFVEFKTIENDYRTKYSTPMPILKQASNVGFFVGFGIPPNLTRLIYKQCNLRFEIPPLLISKNKVEYLDGSFNIFYSWVGPIVPLDNAIHLDLSNNFCFNVSDVFFLRLTRLKHLFIQNNILGLVLPEDASGRILSHVPNLQTIDLSFNRIPTLPFKFFKHQHFLQKLLISDNMLDDVTFCIEHMTNLSILDLSNNRLSFLNQNVTNQLESIYTNNKLLKVDLSGNPLQCTCDTLDFVQWVSTTRIHLNKPKKTQCILHNKTVISLFEIKYVFPVLQKECRSYTSVIVGTMSLVILFASALVWGLIYRHRWKLRYLYYMIKSRHQGTIKSPPNAYDDVYDYDAFISYADNDSEFIHGRLIDILENEACLKLCIHKRDFIPGNDIASNITSAIHTSRKTVVIMSPAYLDSDWCMFEFNMARMESIYSRDKENILFLVFLKQVKPSLLPLYVLELVHSQSYIELPDDQYGETVFWDKLREVLSS